MPWTYYLDTNLQRAFKLTRDAKAEHQQTLTVNLRSSNVLNHTNVTQVGGSAGLAAVWRSLRSRQRPPRGGRPALQLLTGNT